MQIQPAEFAKIVLVIFLAGYLREKRELLAAASGACSGGLPLRKQLSPLP